MSDKARPSQQLYQCDEHSVRTTSWRLMELHLSREHGGDDR